MNTLKIRLKKGKNEFEAEGDEATVKILRDEWYKRLSDEAEANLAIQVKLDTKKIVPDKEPTEKSDNPEVKNLEKLFSLEEDKISLKLKLQGDDRDSDAALLTLYGYKILLAKDRVFSIPLMQSLNKSGYIPQRLDSIMKPLSQKKLILLAGTKRGRNYTITNPGQTEAKKLAKELLDQL